MIRDLLMKLVLSTLTLILLTACGTVAEMRSTNITTDNKFIHAPIDSSCRELWIIHETNYLESVKTNKNLDQIREGAE